MKAVSFMAMLGMLCIMSVPAGGQEREYPRLDVRPQNPSVRDTVLIQIVKGMHGSACVPVYDNVSVRIEQSPIMIYPPHFLVHVSYTETWPEPGVCLPVMTEYGPSCNLGELALGSYYVYDGDSLVGAFSVTDTRALRGAVFNDPGNTRIAVLPQDSVMVRVAVISVFGHEDPIAFQSFSYYDSVMTNREGEFDFPRVPEGWYRLSFEKKGFIIQTISLVVSADTTLRVALIPEGVLATIHGTVSAACHGEAQGECLPQPLAGCTVLVTLTCDIFAMPYGELDGYESLRCRQWTTITDSLGRYSLDSLPVTRSGEWANVSLRLAGYESVSIDTAVYYGFPSTVDVALVQSGMPVTRGTGPGASDGRPAVYAAQAGAVQVRVSKAQVVCVEAFDLSGRRDSRVVIYRQLAAGTHTLRLPQGTAANTRLLRVTVDGARHVIAAGVNR